MIDGDPNAQSGRTTSDERFGRRRRRPAVQVSLVRRSQELVRMLKGFGDAPKPREVHLLRTTIRRVETFFPDEEHAATVERKVQKQLDRVRRRAGKVRDVDVHLKALRTLPRTLDTEGRETLARSLEKARERRLKRLARALADARDHGIVKRLRQVTAALSAAADAHAVDPERAFVAILDDFARARREAEPIDAARLHLFRIAAKRLRYRAEMLPSSTASAAAVTELKRVQDAIGAWHDWLTLGDRAENEIEDRGSPLLAAVRARTETEFGAAIRAVERAARRLEKIRPTAVRKGVRRMSADHVGGAGHSAAALA